MRGKYDLSKIPFKYKGIVSKLLDDKFKGANEKDLYDFILSNSNSFLRMNKLKKIDDISPIYFKKDEITENKVIKKKFNPVYQKLDPINNKYKMKLKEINDIYNPKRKIIMNYQKLIIK